jgi:hypothetical protein
MNATLSHPKAHNRTKVYVGSIPTCGVWERSILLTSIVWSGVLRKGVPAKWRTLLL